MFLYLSLTYLRTSYGSMKYIILVFNKKEKNLFIIIVMSLCLRRIIKYRKREHFFFLICFLPWIELARCAWSSLIPLSANLPEYMYIVLRHWQRCRADKKNGINTGPGLKTK